jgi:phage/plasmid-like protein (TIGR03299 family)
MTQTAAHPPVEQGDVQFSTRDLPWMKLGTTIDQEHVTAGEAAKLGGIDFTVSAQPVYFSTKVAGAPPKFTKVEGRKAIVREDTGDWLSIVSKDYPILQYGEAFDFMDAVSPHFVAAGALRKGRQGFMVIKTDLNVTPFNDDPHDLYAVLRTSHDCSRAVEVMVMPLRGRCMNQMTLRSFTKGVEHRWTVTHTGDVKGKLLAAKESMARLGEYAGSYRDSAQRLCGIKVTDEVAHATLKAVLPDRPTRPEVIERIVTNWHSRVDTVGFDGTGWGLVNAVSEYFDHDRAGGSPESRFLAALQGQTHSAINRTASRILTRA